MQHQSKKLNCVFGHISNLYDQFKAHLAPKKKNYEPQNDFEQVPTKSYEQYLMEAREVLDASRNPQLLKDLENQLIKRDSTKGLIDHIAEQRMISDEYDRKGSELNQILNEENFLYDKHRETGTPMGLLRTSEVEENFQRRRAKAIENFWAKDTIRPKPK